MAACMATGAEMSNRLQGRRAVITGSSSGIGKAIALRFAAEGAHVVVNGRNVAKCEAVAEEIKASGGAVDVVLADVGKAEEARRMIAEAVAKLGGLDILVHNAGGGTIPSSVHKLEDDAIAQVINSNLSSCLWLTRAALPHLRQAESGRILFTSSIAGNRRSMPGFSHYAAAKSGVNGFARNLALELVRSGITVNVVEPGPTRIERWDGIDADELARQEAEIPAGRFGTPEEIASAMLFFASREADYVTGQFLTLDGGLCLGALPPRQTG